MINENEMAVAKARRSIVENQASRSGIIGEWRVAKRRSMAAAK